jgi:hypothetical protein
VNFFDNLQQFDDSLKYEECDILLKPLASIKLKRVSAIRITIEILTSDLVPQTLAVIVIRTAVACS